MMDQHTGLVFATRRFRSLLSSLSDLWACDGRLCLQLPRDRQVMLANGLFASAQ